MILIRSLETQMLGVKSEFDLAHRSSTSKFRDLEHSCAEDHQILVDAGKELEVTVKKACFISFFSTLNASHTFV